MTRGRWWAQSALSFVAALESVTCFQRQLEFVDATYESSSSRVRGVASER